MTSSRRWRWDGSGRDFVDSCNPVAISRLVEKLAPPGTTDRKDWDRRGESGSWAESLPRLASLLERAGLAGCHVILEYNPYQAGRSRVDVILAGESPAGQDSYVVI